MTDRELLEAAAKAAGIELDWDVPPRSPPWRITGEGADRGPAAPWNPITDDGDALRLAVNLGLDVFSRPAQWAECGRIGMIGCREPYQGDPLAATRRAIVRAAAAIASQA